MIFNSLEYFIFLPLVLALYYALGRRGQNGLLLAASYFFYGWWDWRFLSLLLVSTGVDYAVGLAIARRPARKPAPYSKKESCLLQFPPAV